MAERRVVREVGIHRECAHVAAWLLDVEGDADTVVGLDAQRDDVGPQLLVGVAAKSACGVRLKCTRISETWRGSRLPVRI